MSSNEADSAARPQNGPGGAYSGKGARSYLFVIYVLFIIIIMLCINNMVVYESYGKLTGRIEEAAKQYRAAEGERKRLEAYSLELQDKQETLDGKSVELDRLEYEIQSQIDEIRKKNEELERRNKQLEEDNIALQNSLKIAASAGIKPENFTGFQGVNSRGQADREKYVGRFLGTAYTPSAEECGNNSGITNSGKPIIPGVSIAVDNKYWPFGTVFYIKGLGYAVAMDTGSAIKGKYRFDFSVFDRKFAQALGSRKWDVYLVRMGKGYIEDIDF
jgi:3D (Asp-Asp-Asp) domain-containing protein